MLKAILKAAWFPSSVFIIHLILDKAVNIYSKYPPFDIPMHFVGGVAITYFIAHTVKAATEHKWLGNPSKLCTYTLIFFAACTSTIIWEFAEFTSDYFFQSNMQLGVSDTMLDMFMGMLGALSYLAVHRVKPPKA